ncbi:ISL3 family transposase, partial [Ruminococcus bicirculans (ex Wegman et al. 2014)]|uniref:ISL3 family transposase n=2 Tax=Ruminococcus bicirculans (ex Wegman et al. 2014) TaxID=1160721 RepID=UPI00307E0234
MLINHNQNMLCLDEFDILELRENADECDYLFVVSPKIETKICTKCGSCNVVNYGRYTKLVRDININEHYTALKIRGHKHLCKDCGSIFVDRFNTLDLCSKMTNRLRCKIHQLSLTKLFKHIAREYKLSVTTIEKIALAYIREKDSQHIMYSPEVLGIDEAHLNGSIRCVLTDINEHLLFEMLPKRDKQTLINYLDSLPDSNNIKVVTMDMYRPYREAVYECLPDAAIVIDRFHVVKLINDVLSDYRKTLCKQLSAAEKKEINSVQKVLNANRKDLTANQNKKLGYIYSKYPELKMAYNLKEEFREIYECTNRRAAVLKYTKWSRKVKQNFSPYISITETVNRWSLEIFNYFDHPYTNGVTEAINGCIKAIARDGKGYSFEILRRKVLYGLAYKANAIFSYNKFSPT